MKWIRDPGKICNKALRLIFLIKMATNKKYFKWKKYYNTEIVKDIVKYYIGIYSKTVLTPGLTRKLGNLQDDLVALVDSNQSSSELHNSIDVLLNGQRISPKEELQPMCCIMGKTMSFRCHLLVANGWRLASILWPFDFHFNWIQNKIKLST